MEPQSHVPKLCKTHQNSPPRSSDSCAARRRSMDWREWAARHSSACSARMGQGAKGVQRRSARPQEQSGCDVSLPPSVCCRSGSRWTRGTVLSSEAAAAGRTESGRLGPATGLAAEGVSEVAVAGRTESGQLGPAAGLAAEGVDEVERVTDRSGTDEPTCERQASAYVCMYAPCALLVVFGRRPCRRRAPSQFPNCSCFVRPRY